MATRLNVSTGLAELKLGPPKGVVMATTTVERVDGVLNSVNFQLIQGQTKPLLCFDARKVFKRAKEGHFITVRSDFNSFVFEPNVNYSGWLKSDKLETRFWSSWNGNVK